MKVIAEFHCHTTASDGRLSPSQVVELAKEKSVKLLAITDHDTTEGIEEALTRGKELGVNIIPGIELSCLHNGESIHILGYFKGEGYKDSELLAYLSSLKKSRLERATLMVENLKKYFDLKIDLNRVLELGEGVVARPHLAQAIIEAGYNYDWNYIFDKFISKNSPAYVENKKISISEGIDFLKKYNCIVILAHPKLIKKSPVKEFLSYSFDGLEAIYFQNFKRETDELISLCRRNNLLITCGSDFHGILSGDTKHGILGDMSMEEEYFNHFLHRYNS
ncbi:PHP domain-containing protein [Clostridium sp. UBA4548]|uniref:PHP domain-containing protein n=1 Tax=Clostridium sp. UBA4548 TaxID=1946361 RepID=UPI0025BDA98B|nr:PHP domain-containing protein [Clostridium sp. UBA4548]